MAVIDGACRSSLRPRWTRSCAPGASCRSCEQQRQLSAPAAGRRAGAFRRMRTLQLQASAPFRRLACRLARSLKRPSTTRVLRFTTPQIGRMRIAVARLRFWRHSMAYTLTFGSLASMTTRALLSLFALFSAFLPACGADDSFVRRRQAAGRWDDESRRKQRNRLGQGRARRERRCSGRSARRRERRQRFQCRRTRRCRRQQLQSRQRARHLEQRQVRNARRGSTSRRVQHLEASARRSLRERFVGRRQRGCGRFRRHCLRHVAVRRDGRSSAVRRLVEVLPRPSRQERLDELEDPEVRSARQQQRKRRDGRRSRRNHGAGASRIALAERTDRLPQQGRNARFQDHPIRNRHVRRAAHSASG